MSLNLLGAQPAPTLSNNKTWKTGASLLGGVLGGVLLRNSHPVLGILNGLALGRNITAVALREITLRRAAENIGAHIVATAGSLALPSYPVIGYVAGAAGSSLFLSRDDSLIERVEDTVLGRGRKFLTGAAVAPSLADVRAKRGVLRQGMTGDAVKAVQVMLRQRVLSTRADDSGVFDDDTEAEVRDFQGQSHLAVDGAVGHDTLAALEGTARASASSKTTAIVPTSSAVADAGGDLMILGRPAWQVALAGLGIAAIGAGLVMAVR